MKAMILKQPSPVETGPLSLVKAERPKPGPGEVLLKVLACGACHTDLHTVEGELTPGHLPLTPGHQVVGVVEECGAGVTRVKKGDRVGVYWLYYACGQCLYCKEGKENLCDQAEFTGLQADGGYAEYMKARGDFVVPVPPQFDDAQAAPLLCAGIIGYRSLRLSGIKKGQRLGLYGFGASAHIVIQVARYWGCEVYVFTRSQEHQEHARQLRAVWTGDAKDTPPSPMDASITFAPAGPIVPEALRNLRKGGTLAINAVHMSNIPEMPYELLRGERIIRSVAHVTRQDAEEFMQLAAEVPVKTDIEVFPLEEANQVLQRMKRSEIRGAAVLKMR